MTPDFDQYGFSPLILVLKFAAEMVFLICFPCPPNFFASSRAIYELQTTFIFKACPAVAWPWPLYLGAAASPCAGLFENSTSSFKLCSKLPFPLEGDFWKHLRISILLSFLFNFLLMPTWIVGWFLCWKWTLFAFPSLSHSQNVEEELFGARAFVLFVPPPYWCVARFYWQYRNNNKYVPKLVSSTIFQFYC